MNRAEMEKLYTRACKSRRIEPQQEEGQAWLKAFKDFEARDVEAALNAWDNSSELNEQGQPRGKWLPKPVELKPLIEAARRRREANTQGPQDLLLFECASRHKLSCFIQRAKPTPGTKRCPCGSPMECVKREVA